MVAVQRESSIFVLPSIWREAGAYLDNAEELLTDRNGR